ncbi:MAG TPA: hypothetical protein DCQ64_21740, partial [Candidatus Rokubacteria bacterium]|nr:hypothetical protein [Candidatus Rokubacteria bacterium]
MADYFRARGLPVPEEIRPWYLDFRRLLGIAAVIGILWIGLVITDIDTGRANLAYMGKIFGQLLDLNWDVIYPQNEFETFWDGALGLMIVTIFLAVVATAFSVVVALPLSFLAARNLMTGHPATTAIYSVMRV